MSDTQIDSLQIKIVASANDAAAAISNVASAVGKLSDKKTQNAKNFLSTLSAELEKIKTASTAVANISALAQSLGALSGVGSLVKATNGLKNIAPAVNALQATDLAGVSEKMTALANAMVPLSGMTGLSGFSRAMSSLKGLPDINKKLTPETLDSFAEKVKKISEAVTPLSQKLTTVAEGFRAMNVPIKEATQSTEKFNKTISTINISAIINIGKEVYEFVKKVAEAVLKLTDEVIDLDGIIERFSRGFGDSSQEAYSWIKRLNEEMGLNVQMFMQYTSIFAQMLEGLGVAQKDASKMAIGYSELAYDIWAAYNDIYESYGDAVQAVQSAIAGQTRPLRKAGFSVLNVTLKQTAANHGLEVSLQNATEAEKSYLRYLALIDQAQAQGIVGTYAKEMNTAEGQLRTLRQEMRSLTQEAGNLLLPLLTVVVPRVQVAVRLISEAIQKLAALFGVTLRTPEWGNSAGFTEAVEGAEDAAEGIESAMGGAAGSAKELKKTLLGIDEINQLNDAKKNSGGGGGGGGGGTSGIPAGYDWDVSSLWTEAIFKNINSQVDELVQKFKDFYPTLEWIAAGVAGISFATLLIDADKLKAVFSAIGDILLNIGLNVAFTDMVLRADLSTNPGHALLALIGEWVASAGTGIMLAKTLKMTNQKGMGIGFAIGATIQIVTTSIELAMGTVDFNSKNFWIQAISSALMGGVAGMMLIGGPAGFIIGFSAAVALEVIGFTIAWNAGGAAHKEALEKFGEGLGLTEDEIRVYAETMILTPRTIQIAGSSISEADAITMLANVRVDIDKARENIKSSMLALEMDATKLKLGITVNPATLKQDVKNYIDAVQSYIDNTYQEGTISLSILGLEDSPLQSYLDNWYKGSALTELQQKLSEVMEGTLTISDSVTLTLGDEAKAYWIEKLSKEIQDIVNEAAQLRYDAELTGLQLRTQGKLSFDEIIEAINDAVQSASTRGETYDMSMDIDIAIAKDALKNGVLTYQEYLDQLDKIRQGWMENSVSLTNDVLSFGMNTLVGTYGSELTQMYAKFDEQFANLNRDTFNSIKGLITSNIGSMKKDLPEGAADLMTKIMEALLPTVQQQQRLVTETTKTGYMVDQSLIDGINNAQLIAAMLGSVDSQYYLIGQEYSSSPEFYDLLGKVELAAMGIDQRAYEGLANNLDIVYDAATGMITGINNKITGEAIKITPLVRETLAQLGINIPEGLVEGANEGMTTLTGAKGIAYNANLVLKQDFMAQFKPETYSPYGKVIMNGFKSGATPSSSEFNATAQQYQNNVKSALGQYMNEKEFVKYGQAVPAGTKTGMGNGSDLSSHASWILRNINPKTDEVINGMKNIGGNLVKGIIEGMDKESKSQTTSNGIKNVGNKILSLTKYHTEIGSPSKLFADQVGYWLTQGIVVGMDQPDALIDPLKTMYTNAKDWWDDNTMDIVGGDFEFTDESGKNHYMDIKDANNEQNTLLREQNALLRAILEKESSGSYYGTSGEAMLEAASHLNRRTGRTMIPVGG